ncbi:LysR family transcriptional regulator [Ferrovibrio sp.]|uniref:LysR family transcriptional regulator n=1 Tax=Ferrovibrio sp. TaxID=1917215 RepID=UPI00311F82AB
MDQALPGWDLYRSFLAVLREGSLSAAARRLGLTQPTLGRHVAALEQLLGAALFIRSRSGLSPTEAALDLQPYAEALEATAAAALRSASGRGRSIRGSVRVSASEIVAIEVLPPILAGLQAAHPDLVIELVPSNRVENLLLREADIAVRMVAPAQEALVAKRIGAIELGFHAHRDYLARRGTPRSLTAMEAHSLVGYDRETAFIRRARELLPLPERIAFAFRSDSDVAQLAAIRAGIGIGVCQVPLARRDPALVRLLPKAFSFPLETWLAMHENLRDTPRCRVVFDALAKGLAGYIAGAKTG